MANKFTIQELVAFTKGNDESLKDETFAFGIFPNEVARQIAEETKVNIIGAIRLIKPYGIAHALTWHGGVKEFERGQIPLYDTDFDLIPDIVHRYDSFERAADNKRGLAGLYFHKIIGKVRYTVCMTYSARIDRYTRALDKKLTLSTMFKKPV